MAEEATRSRGRLLFLHVVFTMRPVKRHRPGETLADVHLRLPAGGRAEACGVRVERPDVDLLFLFRPFDVAHPPCARYANERRDEFLVRQMLVAADVESQAVDAFSGARPQ